LDWLSGGKQINGVTSDWQFVLSGLPQGSDAKYLILTVMASVLTMAEQ